MVGGSQQGTLDPGFVLFGTRQRDVLVILRELVLPNGFDPVSPSFTVRIVLSQPLSKQFVITSKRNSEI
ncbi:unnamed protein product [Schistosoma margrebowiei]|uniref:Uncharacterized protein n=1 Tax=Schistosoma margrebowiei TaxID=48269 RepID=A0A183MBX1_9TREM|nr:unnamed protein product [Schistosoma margrebowiei]